MRLIIRKMLGKKKLLLILMALLFATISSSGCLETNEGYSRAVIDMDHDGNLHIVWVYLPSLGGSRNDAGGVHYKKLSSEGETLIDDIKLPSGITSRGVFMVVDTNNSAHILYDTQYVKIRSTGEITKKGKTGPGHPDSMTTDSANNIHITWLATPKYTKMNNEWVVVSINSIDHITALPSVRVINDSGKYLFLGDWGYVDLNNNIHEVLNINASNIRESLSYRKISSNGTVLVNTTYRSDYKLYENKRIKIMADSENNLHVAWEELGKGYYAKFDNNGSFLFSKNFSYPPSLFLDSEDNVYILGVKPKNDDKLVLHYTKMNVNGNVLVKKEIVLKTYLTLRFVLTVSSVIIIIVGVAVVAYLIKRRHKITK